VEHEAKRIIEMLGCKLDLNNDFLYCIIVRTFTIQKLKSPLSINFIDTDDIDEVLRILGFAELNFVRVKND